MGTKLNYKYTKMKKGERQYDIKCQGERVDAVYVKSANPAYNGNPFLEAIPRPRTRDEIISDCAKGVPGYDRQTALAMSTEDKQVMYPALKDWRFILPYQHKLETQFALGLQLSYAKRNIDILQTSNGSVVELSSGGSSPYEPFTLLDISGTGKSTSIDALLSGYPQVIQHEFDGLRISQILYLYAVCPPNSNMSTLFETIAKKIDRACGYGEEIYQKQVRKAKNLGEKAGIITDLINRFAIGAIVLDEIQSLDMEKSKESSINYLLSIVNDTGVNLCVAGTEEGYDKVFKTRKIEKRTGVDPSEEMNYYEDPKFFVAMLTDLFQYQWFDEEVSLTKDMIDMFYMKTNGIVDDMVKLFVYMHKDYLDRPARKRPVVDAAFIKTTSEKNFPKREALYENAQAAKTRNINKLKSDRERFGGEELPKPPKKKKQKTDTSIDTNVSRLQIEGSIYNPEDTTNA